MHTKKPSSAVKLNYYGDILSHIVKSFGTQYAIDGFMRSWIAIRDFGDVNMNDAEPDDNLHSLLRLIMRYNRMDLMQKTIALFPEHHKVKLLLFLFLFSILYFLQYQYPSNLRLFHHLPFYI